VVLVVVVWFVGSLMGGCGCGGSWG
jgi:hypothetical protein